jgi:hypothetical protein
MSLASIHGVSSLEYICKYFFHRNGTPSKHVRKVSHWFLGTINVIAIIVIAIIVIIINVVAINLIFFLIFPAVDIITSTIKELSRFTV